jgi:hypothetical protein
MARVGVAALVVALVCFGLMTECSMWNECRKDHSWFYCERVLSR